MDADDLELFAGAVRRAVGAADGGRAGTSGDAGDGTPGGAGDGTPGGGGDGTPGGGGDVDLALAEVGWLDALAEEPGAAVATVFEALGAANATSAALGDVLAAALGLDGAADGPRLAVVLPAPDRWQPPAVADGARLVVRGLASIRRLAGADTAMVVVGSPVPPGAGGAAAPAPGAGRDPRGSGTGAPEPFGAVVSAGLAVVKVTDLQQRPVHGLDPWMGLAEVTGTVTSAAPVRPLPAGAWPRAVRWGRVAVGHQLAGTAATMLDLARQHALDRHQFGRPIAMFQAVRHRLADTLVAVEAARALLDAAWDDGDALTAVMAKAVAGRSARTAARHCQQVLAGIGFTTEHPLHRYLRRALVLDELFGSSHTLTGDVGRLLVADHRLLPPLPL